MDSTPEDEDQRACGKGRQNRYAGSSGRSGRRPCVVYFACDVSQADRDRIFEMGAVLHHKPLLVGGEISHKALRCMGFRHTRSKMPKSYTAVILKHLRLCWTYPQWKKFRFYLFANDDELNLMVIRQLLKYLAQGCQVPVERARILMLSENTRHYSFLQEMRSDSCLRGVHAMRLRSGGYPSGSQAGLQKMGRDRKVPALKDRLTEMIRCHEHPSATYQVSIFGESDIACAGLFRRKPVYRMLGLKEGKQTQPFAMMIFGGGEIGIGVLRRAIAQGQFDGSAEPGKEPLFRAVVVDRNSDAVEARFRLYYPEAADLYNVEFVKDEIFGSVTMQKLKNLGESLKYVVVSLGDDKVNSKTARDISDWFRREGKITPVIAVHLRDEERLLEKHMKGEYSEYGNGNFVRFGAFRDVFSVQELFGERSRNRLIRAVLLKKLYDTAYDIRARVIEEKGNLMVQKLMSDEKGSVEAFLEGFRAALDEEMEKLQESFLKNILCEPEKRKEWLKELYRGFYDDALFNQMSNIGAAENLEVYLEQGQCSRNYRNEHLRWNAFHRVHGWRAMSPEEFTERAEIFFMADLQKCLYKYIKAADDGERLSAVRELAGIKPEDKPFWKYKFQKDDKRMKHACITDWDGLLTLDLNETRIRTDLYKTITGVLGGFEGNGKIAEIRKAGEKEKAGEIQKLEVKRQEGDNLQDAIECIQKILLQFLTDIPCYQLYDKVFVNNAAKIHEAARMLEKYN
jgi:hypothetical protein